MKGERLVLILALWAVLGSMGAAARQAAPKLPKEKMDAKGFIAFNGYYVALMKREQLVKVFPTFTITNSLGLGVQAGIDGGEAGQIDAEEQKQYFLEPGEHAIVFAVRGKKSKPITVSVLAGRQSRIQLIPKSDWPELDVPIPADVKDEAKDKAAYTYAPHKGKDVRLVFSHGEISRATVRKAYTKAGEIALALDGKSMPLDRDALRAGKLTPTACYVFQSVREGKFLTDSLAGYIVHDPLSTQEMALAGLTHLAVKEHGRRAYHIELLAEARDKSAKPPLLEVLADAEEPEHNQTAAAKALAAIASSADVPRLEKLAKGEISKNTEAALQATIRHLKERSQIPQLIKALNTGEEREKVDAISALRDYATDVDVDVFVKVLKTSKLDSLREIAAEGLDRIQRPEAMDALLDMAQDKDPVVRQQVAKTAGARLSWKAIPVLLGYAKDPEPRVRKAACEALGKLGVAEAVPLMLDLLEDPDGEVAQAAGEALKQITREGYPFNSGWPEKERKEAIKTWRDWWNK